MIHGAGTRWLAAGWLLVLAGCQSLLGSPNPSPTFYLLTPLAAAPPPAAGKVSSSAVQPVRCANLLVEPVQLPGYLKRPNLVTRQGATRIRLAEFERWGEALETNFDRVFAGNLASLHPRLPVIPVPVREPPATGCRLRVTLERFEGDGAANQAVLSGTWQLQRFAGTVVGTAGEGRVELTREWNGEYAELAPALSRLVAELSEKVAVSGE